MLKSKRLSRFVWEIQIKFKWSKTNWLSRQTALHSSPTFLSRVFHIRTEMPILAFSSLLCENKKISSDKILPQLRIEPRPLIASDSKSNTLLPGGNILVLESFCFHTVETKMPILTFLCVCEKLDCTRQVDYSIMNTASCWELQVWNWNPFPWQPL